MPSPVHPPTALVFSGLLAAAVAMQGAVFIIWPEAVIGAALIPTYIFALFMIILGGGVISHVGNVRTSESVGGNATRLRWVGIILVTVAGLIGLLFYVTGDSFTSAWIVLGIGLAWLVAVLVGAFGSRVFYMAFSKIEVDAEG